MAQPTLQINTVQFNNLLREYSVLTNKTFRQTVNRTALNVAFEALKRTPKVDRSKIETLADPGGHPDFPWPGWPKYVASRLRKAVTFTVRRGTQLVNAKKVKFGGGASYTRAQAQQVSRRIIGARIRSIGFIKSGWLPAIRLLWPLVKDKPPKSINLAKQYGQPKGYARIGGDDVNSNALIANSAEGVTRVAVPALRAALIFVMQDMRDYLNRKLGRDTAQVVSKQLR